MQGVLNTPFRAMMFMVLALALVVLAATSAVRAPPWLGLDLAPDMESGRIAVRGADPGGPAADMLSLSGRVPAWFVAIDGMSLTDIDRIEESDFLPRYEDVRTLFARQSTALAALEAGPVNLTFETAGGQAFSVVVMPGKRPVSDLPLLFWLQLMFGGLAMLIGAWLWSLRPRDLAVIMFALTGAGLMMATGSAAIYSSRELALDGALFRALSAINHIGALTFGAGMTAVFALYPKPLFKNRLPLAILGAAVVAWCAADLSHLAFNPQIGSYLPVMVLTTMIFGLIGVQWWVNRKDPRNRAALGWLGLSVFVGISGYVLGNATPVLLGDTPALPQGLLLGSFLLIYVGLALGIGRYRLFQLDQWAYRTVFYTGGALAVLAADAALIFALQIERIAALGVSLLLIGLIYLPLRDTLWRLLTAKKRTSPNDLFGLVMETALAGQQAEREARWRNLVTRLFDPLSLEASSGPVTQPAILDDGLELRLPATEAGPALALRFARGGRSLFGSEDLLLARQTLDLMRQAEASRKSYERGASEERRRVAQDLHDDVGARLLSGLHKPDLAQTRNALREAIADIRMVVGGLSGENRPLDHVLADLRYEASERLAGAGISLDWPLDDESAEISLDYTVQKALRSAVREVVSNAIRHSGATRVTVRAERVADSIRLVVSDDGVGLPDARATGDRQGFGLLGLMDRMETMGGKIVLPKVAKGLTLDMTFNLAGRSTSPVSP